MTEPDEVEIPTGRVTGQTTTPIESATVILLRDGPEGLEVFMLERHIESDFAGGALVFPGGRVEAADQQLDTACWTGLDVDSAAAAMEATPELALGWHVAAVRETFEESGFLLAERDGTPVRADDLAVPALQEARRRLAARDSDLDWEAWLREERLVLDLGRLVWWSWWVTPPGLHKRYETRFFVTRVPEDQVGGHDRVEVVDSTWATPAAALVAARDGRATVIYPTRRNLDALAAFPTAAAVVGAARRGEVDLRRTVPEIVRLDDGTIRVRNPHTGELDEP
ncbi:MAG: NUDIX hydrolase [Nitriliruptorales bacterium]